MLIYNFLLACVSIAYAAPVRHSLDVDSRGIDSSDTLVGTRGFNGPKVIKAHYRGTSTTKNPKFAVVSETDKERAKKFVASARISQLEDASATSNTPKTVHENNQLHLDRQQQQNDRLAAKAAVQLNEPRKKGGPTTIGQVVVPYGTNPDPKTVAARLKYSIDTGREQTLPDRSRRDRKAANIAKNIAVKDAKKSRVDAKLEQGVDRAKAGIFKKGNGKPSAVEIADSTTRNVQ